MFFAVVAISYVVSLYYKEFEPQHIVASIIGSLLFAIAIIVIKSNKAKQAS